MLYATSGVRWQVIDLMVLYIREQGKHSRHCAYAQAGLRHSSFAYARFIDWIGSDVSGHGWEETNKPKDA